MSAKTIFIVILTVLVTVILMNNTEEIDFWIFGIARIPKLAILGAMFAIGFILGMIVARPRKKIIINEHHSSPVPDQGEYRSNLSDEDRDYIS